MTYPRTQCVRLALACAPAGRLSGERHHARGPSRSGGAHKLLPAENCAERHPNADEFYVVVDAAGAFGQVLTREGDDGTSRSPIATDPGRSGARATRRGQRRRQQHVHVPRAGNDTRLMDVVVQAERPERCGL